MTPHLTTLRQTPQPSPARFLTANPGCWIQYYDDTEARDSSRALSARTFDPNVAEARQRLQCAVCFSLQAFGTARVKEQLLCYRSLGADIDLVTAAEHARFSTADIDRRKETYLDRRLLPFPLKPHWVIETLHGFHVIFRIQPQREELSVREAVALNDRLVRALGADRRAALLTQVLRVPGLFQFKDPGNPFLCRLLMDNGATIWPYPLDAVRAALLAWEARHGFAPADPSIPSSKSTGAVRAGIGGVPEGGRNTAAAALAGAILGRLPDYLWEAAGWGGLKEWNARNAVPLPERELRSVFLSIARREQAKREAGSARIQCPRSGHAQH